MARNQYSKDYLREIKNTIIGNPSAKAAQAAHSSLSIVLECLNPHRHHLPAPVSLETRVEAANVIYSLSSGSPDALLALLQTETLTALLEALVSLTPESPKTLSIATARAFRTLVSSTADVLGMGFWGTAIEPSPILAEHALYTLKYLFQFESLDIWLPLLSLPLLQSFIAETLANTLRTPTSRHSVGHWLPKSEREKEYKGKRGWEYSEGVRPTGGWVCRHLVEIAASKDIKVQVAALGALAALAKDNTHVAGILKADHEGTSTLKTFVLLLRSRSVELRLAAAHCIVNILRATPHPDSTDRDICLTIAQTLRGIYSSTSESYEMRARACFIVSHFASDELNVAELLVESGCLVALLEIHEELYNNGVKEGDNDDETEESPQLLLLREAIFTSLASLATLHNPYRRQTLSSPSILPSLSSSLLHPNLGIRYSSIQLTRICSRSIDVLRTSLAESDVPAKVLELVMRDVKQDGGSGSGGGGGGMVDREGGEEREGESRSVVNAALAVLCNLVHDCAPFREVVLPDKGLKRLIEHSHCSDESIRLNALWAIKNSMVNASLAYKQQVMSQLTWDYLVRLTNDPEMPIKEQGLTIIQNLTITLAEVEYLVAGLGSASALINILHSGMSCTNSDVALVAARTVQNLSTSTEPYRTLITSSHPLLLILRDSLSHPRVEIRRACARTFHELLLRKGYKDLKDSGVESAMRAIVGGRRAGTTTGGGHHTTSVSGFDAYVGGGAAAAAAMAAANASGTGTSGSGLVGGFGPSGGLIVGSPLLSPGGGGGGFESAGIMGREEDREVKEVIKTSLFLFSEARDKETLLAMAL